MFHIFFAAGLILGVIPGLVWGALGGDETFGANHPKYRKLLKEIHHWTIGLIGFIASANSQYYFPSETFILLMGLFVSMYLDDMLFHCYEKYFERKVEEIKNGELP